jgi:glycosyltransferase
VIIDGGSTDGTLEILQECRSVLSKVISEPDRGIYDAMNKGLLLAASGDIIGFLNADDFYASSDVISKVLNIFEDQNVDSCYGDLIYVDPADTDRVVRYWKAGPYNYRRFYWGWMPPHPTFFVRKRVFDKYGYFDLSLGSAADYELMLRFLLRHKVSTSYIPEVLVKMRVGGVSNALLRNRLLANRNDRMAWKINGLKPYPWTLYLKPFSKLGQYIFRSGWQGED